MDKNTVIGFILIAAVLFGFTFYQSNRAKKYAEEHPELLVQYETPETPADSTVSTADSVTFQYEDAVEQKAESIFKDSLLDSAYNKEGEIIRLENNRIAVEFNTKGAQPYSVMVKDYFNYDSTSLYLFKPEGCSYSISIYTGEMVRTSDFVFDVVERSSERIVMRLKYSNGGYIEQKYELSEDSYQVLNSLSFVGMDGIIPRNVNSFDIDYSVMVPRMERGYKNELQYSKLDYYFEGDKKPVEMGRGRSASKRIDSKLSWFAFHQQFFSAIMCSPSQFASGTLSNTFYPESDPDRKLMLCEAHMRSEFVNGPEVTIPFEFYFGPNHYKTLKSFNRKYEKTIPLGGNLVGWFTKFVIIPLFNFLHKYIASYGLIILLMTLIIKTVVLPLTYKSYSSSAKMQALKPEIEKINAKYPKQEDALKKQQATMDLYKRAGASPTSGCLPTLLTFPILWAMFRFFPASIELRQQGFLWADDLSTYDSIVDFGTRIPLIGDHLSLFALLMAITMWLYSKITMACQPTANDPSASSMRFMSVWMMPIMMFFICNNLSAGLSYYYLLSQLIAIGQTWLIRRKVDPEAVLAKAHESASKPSKKSKWQQRLEEAQKMQQQQLKQRGR